MVAIYFSGSSGLCPFLSPTFCQSLSLSFSLSLSLSLVSHFPSLFLSLPSFSLLSVSFFCNSFICLSSILDTQNEDSRYIRANGSIGYANGHLNGAMPELINGHLPNGKGYLGTLPMRHTQTYISDDPYATMKSNHTTGELHDTLIDFYRISSHWSRIRLYA